MKLTFSEIANSDAYERHASAVAKANIAVATAVAAFIIFFRDWGFGLWWFLIIPILWFAASLLVAMPFTALKVLVAAANSDQPRIARAGTAVVDFLNYVVLVPLTYFSLRALHQFMFAE